MSVTTRLSHWLLLFAVAACTGSTSADVAALPSPSAVVDADTAIDEAALESPLSAEERADLPRWGIAKPFEVQANGYTFSGLTSGPKNGKPVILLHGFPQFSFEWRSQLEALGRAGYFVIAPDQRGYAQGARPMDVPQYDRVQLVKDVVAIADAFNMKRFHLVGHDWGAVIAWSVAATVPTRLRSLSAMAVPHVDAFQEQLANSESCQYKTSSYFDFFRGPDSQTALLANNAAGLRRIYTGLAEEVIERYVRFFSTPDTLKLGLNYYRANISDTRQVLGAPLGKISVPTLYIYGDADNATCREAADATARFVSAPYTYEVLPGVNHWTPEVASADVNFFLLNHFRRHRR